MCRSTNIKGYVVDDVIVNDFVLNTLLTWSHPRWNVYDIIVWDWEYTCLPYNIKKDLDCTVPYQIKYTRPRHILQKSQIGRMGPNFNVWTMMKNIFLAK